MPHASRYNPAMLSPRSIRFAAALGLLALAGAMTGCVERRITIASDPSGALAMVNDVEVGRTPISVPFTWYGDYDIRLRYEKNVGTPEKPVIEHYYLHTHRKTITPWFETLGVDLFAELAPVRLKDEQLWGFDVPKVPDVSDEQILRNARELKAEAERPK